jgi:amino acid transporter
MADSRAIGRWALTGLMINSMIGSGIFGIPGELARLLGKASPLACILAGLAIAVIIACFVEVGSQFAESGGPYLYVRTAFGPLMGIQIAWFTALTPMAAAAAQSTLFVSYLESFHPSLGAGPARLAVIAAVIGIPMIANLIGLRAGKSLSSLLVIAKLAPLLLLIGAGLFYTPAPAAPAAPALAPAASSTGIWLSAMLLAVFGFGGFENALAATGAVDAPRRSVPFALTMSLAVCIVINTLIQWVTAVALERTGATDRPLAAAAAVMIGPWGATLMAVAALISTSGAISATVLAVPRLLAALGERGDLPKRFARARHDGTPVFATLTVAGLVYLLGVTGTFKWALAVTSGSMTIFAGAVCAALPRLRSLRPEAAALRIPGGPALAVLGVVLSLLLLLQLTPSEAAPIAITVAVALLNWWLVRRRMLPGSQT